MICFGGIAKVIHVIGIIFEGRTQVKLRFRLTFLEFQVYAFEQNQLIKVTNSPKIVLLLN